MHASTPPQTDIDTRYMRLALAEAKKGIYSTRPNPSVGCVIVRFDEHGDNTTTSNLAVAGNVVGKGFHVKVGEPHAEVFALREAGERAHGATAYVTLEPCSHYGRTPPCAEALIKARVARVVVALEDPNPKVAGRGIAMLQEAGIEVLVGVCEPEARAVNTGFLKTMAGGLPYVRLKIAASLDGRTAMASKESKWITGEAARADVQRLRALSGAVITGSGTVLADNPRLTVRQDMQSTPLSSIVQPISVILDRRGRIDDALAKKLKIFNNKQVLIFSNKQDASPEKSGKSYKQYAFECLTQVLQVLRDEYNINDILVEAGSTLSTAFIQADLVDELILYQAPMLLGSTARPMLDMPIDALKDAWRFDVVQHGQIGCDLVTYLKSKG